MPYTLSTKLAMAQFVQTHHGGKALLHEGYKYLKIRDGKECTFWRCERHKSQCPARVTTNEGSVQSSRGENGECSLAKYLASVRHQTGL